MKVVILCGGKGTRMREETEFKPKPLVTIGGMPILWHIMMTYSTFGFKEFILCLGYKGDMIKEHFMSIEWLSNDFSLELGKGKGKVTHHAVGLEDWTITFADTGDDTETGGRVKRIQKYVEDDEFLLTYGDGLADIDIDMLVKFHHETGKVLTVTGIHPPSRFGILDVDDGVAKSFREKPALEGLVNGGYMVCKKDIFEYLDDNSIFERMPMQKMAKDGGLAVYHHKGSGSAWTRSRRLRPLTATGSREYGPGSTGSPASLGCSARTR